MTYQPGGSNYPLYSVGSYVLDNGSDASYYKSGNLMPVVRDFHLHPDIVTNQLQQMHQTGQRVISFNIWFMHYDGSLPGPISDSSKGVDLQTAQNIASLCRLVAAIGFKEVHVRFLDQGPNSPIWWTSWEDAMYIENRSFIMSVRAVFESSFVGSNVTRWYDLGGDRGGDVRGQNPGYMRILWQSYVGGTGGNDSFGFGIEPLQTAIKFQIGIYDAVGKRPNQWGLQMYDGLPWTTAQLLGWAAFDLKAANEINKPIVILETWYDDRNTASELKAQSASNGLSLRTIVQWPLQETHPSLQFDMNFPASAQAYQ